jgi:PAS domain-containing protein
MKDRSAVTSDGRVLGIASIARDITERVRADEQARAASQYARSLIEASLDALVTISPEGKITDVNEATVEFPDVARGALERIGVAACKWEISSSGGGRPFRRPKARRGRRARDGVGGCDDRRPIRHRRAATSP